MSACSYFCWQRALSRNSLIHFLDRRLLDLAYFSCWLFIDMLQIYRRRLNSSTFLITQTILKILTVISLVGLRLSWLSELTKETLLGTFERQLTYMLCVLWVMGVCPACQTVILLFVALSVGRHRHSLLSLSYFQALIYRCCDSVHRCWSMAWLGRLFLALTTSLVKSSVRSWI